MKKTEFAKLLSDLPENYILEAQAHRTGARRPGGERGLVLKYAIAAALAVLMIGGFFWALEKQTHEPTTQQASPMQTAEKPWQMEIVNSKRSFQSDTYGCGLTIEEYTQRLREKDPDCIPRAYVKIDLDQDGQEELAIRFEKDKKHVLTLIIWQDGENIRGAEYARQDMSFLKEDGTFYYLDRGHWGWGRLERREDGWKTVIRMPQGDNYSGTNDAWWRAMPGTEKIPTNRRNSCLTLGYSGRSGVSGPIVGELTEMGAYSLYVPITGWTYESTIIGQYAADCWVCDEDPDARLSVIKTGTDVDALSWLAYLGKEPITRQRTEGELQLVNRYSQTVHSGAEGAGTTMEVVSRLGETTNYVIQMEYADEAWDKDVMYCMVDSIYFYDSVTLNMPVDRVFNLDGESMMECHLEGLDGYSLYIPSYWGEQTAVEETIGYHDANTWYGPDGESLSIVDLGKMNSDDAMAWTLGSQGWTMSETEGNTRVTGTRGDERLEVTFKYRVGNWTYAVIKRCPKDKTEEVWPVLEAMVSTIGFS